MKKIIVALSALALSAGAASAATTSTANQTDQTQQGAQPQDQSNAQATAQPGAKIAKQMRDNLSQAGFTDIKIMPESFLIRAKDKDGNPVMMVVNPDSVAALQFTETNPSKNNSNAPSGNTSGSTQK